MHIVEEIVVDHNFEGIEIGGGLNKRSPMRSCDKHGQGGRYVFKIEKQKLM